MQRSTWGSGLRRGTTRSRQLAPIRSTTRTYVRDAVTTRTPTTTTATTQDSFSVAHTPTATATQNTARARMRARARHRVPGCAGAWRTGAYARAGRPGVTNSQRTRRVRGSRRASDLASDPRRVRPTHHTPHRHARPASPVSRDLSPLRIPPTISASPPFFSFAETLAEQVEQLLARYSTILHTLV